MKFFSDDDLIRGLKLGIEDIKRPAIKENRPLNEYEVYECGELEKQLKKRERLKRHFKRTKELAQKGFIEESIILTVTTFEFLMRDLIKDSRSQWFFLKEFRLSKSTPDVKTTVRKKIKRYLEGLNLFDQYIKNLYIYQESPNPDIEALYYTLFDDENQLERVSFQNLNRPYGIKGMFKFFFDIDIRDIFDSDKQVSQQKWKLFERLIKERHKIVHLGDSATLNSDQVVEVINSIDLLYHYMHQKTINHSISQFKADFDDHIKNLSSEKIL